MLRGIDGGFYRNSAALGAGWATPTWNLVDGIQDLDHSDTLNMFNSTIRRMRGLETEEPTTSKVTLGFKLLVPDTTLYGTTTATSTGNPDWDDFRAFQTARRTRRPLDIMVLDGLSTVNGVEGFRMFVKVAEFSKPQRNQDGIFVDVKLSPCLPDETTLATSPTAVSGLHVRVAAGAPTFSLWDGDTFSYTPS